MNRFLEWLHYDVGFVGFMVWLFLGIALLLIGAMIYTEVRYPCKRYADEATYHSPTYVLSGKILIPVGGGYWKECVER